ncbi:putative FMN reductase [Blattamonas nauphoetae]|uniref:FMN reductase n=1 Tax=Blattamonas nauphoetae TaxID=2049346 RepID=A0ABQ9YHV5_9EUKA|nr:putative FMN reductase [Blattamonas nauphoetae]
MSEAKVFKLVAFNGSPHRNGATAQLMNFVIDELKKEGVECELIHLCDYDKIRGCRGCYACTGHTKCMAAAPDDPINSHIEKILASDCVMIGSPTHYANVSVATKSLIDRAGLVASSNGHLYKGKIGVPIISAMRNGTRSAYNAIDSFFSFEQMPVASVDWNTGISMKEGEILKEEGTKENLTKLAQQILFMLQKLRA